jgi:copper chaperone CopZ
MTTKTYQLETVSCPSCIAKIEGMLRKTEGVAESRVSFATSKVKVNFDEAKIGSDQIRERIVRLGYAVLGEK